MPSLLAALLCLATIAGLAGGCLNPRPEEVPSVDAVIEINPRPDNPSLEEPPRAPEPAPTSGGGDDWSDEGELSGPGGSEGEADAGAPDGGLRALDTSGDVDTGGVDPSESSADAYPDQDPE